MRLHGYRQTHRQSKTLTVAGIETLLLNWDSHCSQSPFSQGRTCLCNMEWARQMRGPVIRNTNSTKRDQNHLYSQFKTSGEKVCCLFYLISETWSVLVWPWAPGDFPALASGCWNYRYVQPSFTLESILTFILFYVYSCFSWMCVYAPYVCLEPSKARRECQIPKD